MQFSLRSLLVLVFLAALMAAVFRAEADRNAQAALLREFDNKTTFNSAAKTFDARGGPPAWHLEVRSDAALPILNRLRNCNVTSFEFINMTIDDNALIRLRQLPRLNELGFYLVRPATGMSWRLPRVRKIVIRELDNHVYPIDLFCSLPALESLQLEYVSVEGQSFANLRHNRTLRELKLCIRTLSQRQLDEICDASYLTDLDLSGSWFPTAEPLARLRRLRSLRLDGVLVQSGNEGQEAIGLPKSMIANLPHMPLQKLSLWCVDDDDLKVIGECTRLRDLELDSGLSGRSLAELRHLKQLKRLTLTGHAGGREKPISEEFSLANLPWLPAVEEFSVWGTNVKETDFRWLARVPNVRKITMPFNVDRRVIPVLQSLKHLQCVSFGSDRNCRDVAVELRKRCPHLKVLVSGMPLPASG